MMTNKGTFEIRDKFYLNGKPFQIVSGGIHYFRVLPEYWEDRLQKLKELGCNTVETYIPWNMHEPEKGRFDFYGEKVHGMLDVVSFVRTAQRLGLWVILRPSPYICAEWDFGGLPAWLLAQGDMALRTSDERYLRHVRAYYDKLMPLLAPLQIDHGGPVIMLQVENEYGSFGNDKKYLESLRDMMRAGGITMPLFASDGPDHNMLSNTKIDGVFPTANFGSGTKRAFSLLEEYTDGGPCMCTEFWIGWFDAWHDEAHHKGNTEAAVKELEELLKLGNVNIYMFEGGTNFGFMNGSNYGDHLTADVTSYDYDALLTEDGQITEKYRRFQEIIGRYCGKSTEAEAGEGFDDSALSGEATGEKRSLERTAYGACPVSQKVDLFHVLDCLAEPVETISPMSMERLGQSYGYTLYSSVLHTERQLHSIRLYQAADRAICFADGKRILTAADKELLERHEVEPVAATDIRLDILMENMGRVNYGPMINWQRKGIDGCVMINDRFAQHGWRQYCLPMDNLEKLDFGRGYEEGMPAFYRFSFDTEEIEDTFLDCSGWGKGCVFVNGFALGRFWEAGPQKRLYLPGALLKKGKNEIILFETEGKCADSITLLAEPDLG
ncbi:glycoside hydrolase family 35 protein [Eisenbergiella sp.]